jgi:hypothetical protein
MYVPKAIFVLVLAFNAAGCASVVSGTSQTLTLDTVPAGADCTLTRKGLSIGRVNPTPGAVVVQRTRDDITVSCTRDGYQTGTFVNKSGLEGATFGNISGWPDRRGHRFRLGREQQIRHDYARSHDFNLYAILGPT